MIIGIEQPHEYVSQRLDLEFAAATATRDLLDIAKRGGATYADALAFGAKIAPEILSPEKSILHRAQERPVIREYRAIAEARSINEKRDVTPEEVVLEEIKKLETLVSISSDKRDLLRRLKKLQRCYDYFAKKDYYEDPLIRHDVYQVERGLGRLPRSSVASETFKLSGGRSLNIRVLHPNRPEHITGADLIYEICSQEQQRGRIAFIQYKIWEKNQIPFSVIKPEQLYRLKETACDREICIPQNDEAAKSFRMPFCSAFLRLTNKLQTPESRLVSAGYFLPVCRVQTGKRGSLKLSEIRNHVVGSALFEEAFIQGVIGSDWLPFDEIEAIYQRAEIFRQSDTLVIHAQESVW